MAVEREYMTARLMEFQTVEKKVEQSGGYLELRKEQMMVEMKVVAKVTTMEMH
jgi:hypothetical protein